MLIDSHAHLASRQYADDRDEVLARCRENGVERIVEIGAFRGFEGNEDSLALAESEDMVYLVTGLHPHDARLMNDPDWERIRQIAAHPKTVGIGETGFDFYYDHSSPEEQERAFVRHIGLARETGLPLVIHDRDAHRETLAVLDREKAFDGPGVFHCFSGDWTFAREVIARGWYLALGGVVTFKNAQEIHDVARHVPLAKLLLETDAPYLAPVPKRGKRNEPWFARFSAERIAELRDADPAEILEATARNAVKLFGLGLNPEEIRTENGTAEDP